MSWSFLWLPIWHHSSPITHTSYHTSCTLYWNFQSHWFAQFYKAFVPFFLLFIILTLSLFPLYSTNKNNYLSFLYWTFLFSVKITLPVQPHLHKWLAFYIFLPFTIQYGNCLCFSLSLHQVESLGMEHHNFLFPIPSSKSTYSNKFIFGFHEVLNVKPH